MTPSKRTLKLVDKAARALDKIHGHLTGLANRQYDLEQRAIRLRQAGDDDWPIVRKMAKVKRDQLAIRAYLKAFGKTIRDMSKL